MEVSEGRNLATGVLAGITMFNDAPIDARFSYLYPSVDPMKLTPPNEANPKQAPVTDRVKSKRANTTGGYVLAMLSARDNEG